VSSPRKPVETTSAGLEPLAVLPLFLRLQGRRAVVAGGSAAAAWKAKLLAAAGAAVDVFAPEPSDEMRQAQAPEAAGSIAVHARAWRPDDLAGATLAVAASDDEEECAVFVAAARAQGVIVNAVDRPHLCDVQFGAVVNRSPLVVGISTGGAAPVFGQAVRSRIETLLPRGFARWVEAAKRWRDGVTARFAGAAERRAFWERFSDRAMAEAHREPAERDLAELAAATGSAKGRERGSVVLVGAGPGDPELLTLKAVRALRLADIILYDDLVAPQVLDYARREARTMLVGKTGHGPSCRQDEINALMVRLAREGKRVVRLKGGDPLIFSRAAEELEACAKAGLSVDVVPGISAVQGAAARLQMPLTHRSIARRLQFLTGHDMRGELPDDLNWSALADPSAMTAIYMPRRTIGRILATAVRRGLPPATPALAIFNATRPDEHLVHGTASTLANAMQGVTVKGPALVIVGEALRTLPYAADNPADLKWAAKSASVEADAGTG
jgi:uroporphyrin-III C-methyltransferase/precorrin-2 dehydrogenase/sirohydrochlorin ferrochelatase